MNKVKSIKQIYNEAKQYDCVLTTDAALARGLNRLIDTPRLGIFAVTPRQLVQKYSDILFTKIYSKFEFVSIVSKETGKPFRLIHAFTENILNIWNQSGLLEFTEIHLSDELKELLPYFEKYPMTEYAMQSFDDNFFAAKKIAVIGKELFNELDLQVLPKNIFYNEISVYADDKYTIQKTFLFGNTKTLIDNIVQLITKDNMNYCAIVLEPNSDYNILLQTRLKEEGIDILIKNTYGENLTVRFMLNLIENSFAVDLLQAGDLKEAGQFFGFEIDSRMDDYNLEVVVNAVPDKKLKTFYKLMADVQKFTFGSFTSNLIEKFNCAELTDFIFLLDKLNFSNENISEEKLIELKYILENFPEDIDSRQANRGGVLFADSKNSAFVNREIIFYTGIDESWSISTTEKQYIDKVREDKINLEKFEILLQQGSERLYFTQEVKDNKEVLPAPYFSIIENRTITDFNDKIFNPVFIYGENSAGEIPDNIITLHETAEEVTGIAPTPLKRFVLCPAKYFYDSLTPQKDAPHFLKGNLIHDFAEMYYQHPEFCKENYSKIMDYVLKKYSNMIMKSEAEIERTNFKIALDNISSFLDSTPVEKILLDKEVTADKNDMMLYFKKKKIYDNSEKDLPKDFILRGRADLRDKKTLVDYKSGSSRYKLKDLSKLINVDYIFENEESDFDFQAISYLAALQNENPGQDKLKFIYNYVLANRKNLLDDRLKAEDNRTEFTYIDLTFAQYLQTENCYEYVKESTHKDCKKYFDALSFLQYKGIFDEVDLGEINFFDKEGVSKIFCREIMRSLAIEGHSFKTFRKREERTYIDELKKAAEIFANIRCAEGLIFKDDVKKFIDFVKDKLSKLNSYRKNNFPALPLYESNQICKECDYLNMCRGNLLWN
jgi:hypothetical protein